MSHSKVKIFFHGLWPKLLVIAACVVLYLLASYCLSGDLKDLVIGFAGGLILIPLVFRDKSADEPVMLDVKPVHITELCESPLPAYVISEDYYGI